MQSLSHRASFKQTKNTHQERFQHAIKQRNHSHHSSNSQNDDYRNAFNWLDESKVSHFTSSNTEDFDDFDCDTSSENENIKYETSSESEDEENPKISKKEKAKKAKMSSEEKKSEKMKYLLNLYCVYEI